MARTYSNTPEPRYVKRAQFCDDGGGEDGATFVPTVSAEGIISWTNNKSLPNPESVNIKGPRGEKGNSGAQGPQGPQGPKGDTGPQGPKGDSADIQLVDLSTLDVVFEASGNTYQISEELKTQMISAAEIGLANIKFKYNSSEQIIVTALFTISNIEASNSHQFFGKFISNTETKQITDIIISMTNTTDIVVDIISTPST